MTRPSCFVLVSVLVGLLASSACAPAVAPAASPSPRLMLAEAAPASTDAPSSATPPPPPGPLAPASASGKSETYEDRDARQLGRTWGWTAVGIGASSLAIALGTSVLMLEDASTRSSNCNAQKVCNANGITANDQLTDLGPWNAALWAVGVVGVGIGAYLLIVNPTDRAMGTQVGIAPNGSGASFQLRSSF
jgi:hypothetical protein